MESDETDFLDVYKRQEYGVLDHYISNLTGIQNVQIKNAPLLEEALKQMCIRDRVDTTEFQEVIKCDNIVQCMEAVTNGRADYAVGDRSALE